MKTITTILFLLSFSLNAICQNRSEHRYQTIIEQCVSKDIQINTCFGRSYDLLYQRNYCIRIDSLNNKSIFISLIYVFHKDELKNQEVKGYFNCNGHNVFIVTNLDIKNIYFSSLDTTNQGINQKINISLKARVVSTPSVLVCLFNKNALHRNHIIIDYKDYYPMTELPNHMWPISEYIKSENFKKNLNGDTNWPLEKRKNLPIVFCKEKYSLGKREIKKSMKGKFTVSMNQRKDN